MFETKNLITAALLASVAMASFAQAPAVQKNAAPATPAAASVPSVAVPSVAPASPAVAKKAETPTIKEAVAVAHADAASKPSHSAKVDGAKIEHKAHPVKKVETTSATPVKKADVKADVAAPVAPTSK